MPLSFRSHRLAAAAVIAGGAIGALAGPGSAAAALPGTNGTIVATKCEDGEVCSAGHIWAVDPGSGVQQQLTSGSEYDDDPSVSPDGRRIVFERCPTGAHCRIAIMDASGANQTDLTDGSATADDYPSFSPDGSRIAFQRSDASGQHIELMNVDGSNLTALPGGSASDHNAVFSLDGSSIVFERYALGLGYRIFKAPVDGSSPPVALSSGPHDYDPSISPDGSQIVFQRDNGVASVWIMNADGGNPHQVTAPGAGVRDQQPAFSPDGSQIVFERYDSSTTPGTSPLMAMNADGSNLHPITASTDYFYKPDWQPLHPVPAAGPAPADTTAHAVTLGAPKRERVSKGRVYLFATSSEAATAVARGKVASPGLAAPYRLRAATKTLTAGTRTRIVLKIPRRQLQAIRAALSRGHKLKAKIVVQVKNGAGNTATGTLAIRLKR
jgi:TolB protein